LDVGRPENKRRNARIAAMLAGGSSFQQVKRQFFWIMQSAPASFRLRHSLVASFADVNGPTRAL